MIDGLARTNADMVEDGMRTATCFEKVNVFIIESYIKCIWKLIISFFYFFSLKVIYVEPKNSLEFVSQLLIKYK